MQPTNAMKSLDDTLGHDAVTQVIDQLFVSIEADDRVYGTLFKGDIMRVSHES